LLTLTGCTRDLALPGTTPPRLDAVHLVAREAVAAPAGGLPVLAGQLVAVRGGGFPAEAGQVQVEVGGVTAEVRRVEPGRIVIQVPSLSTGGQADLRLTTPAGFRTLAGAVRYDGPGQPAGLAVRDLRTAVPLWALLPVEGGAQAGPELALGVGASDSALVFVASLGAAIATVPLGLVPASAAARLGVTPGSPGTATLEVLALDRDGLLAVAGLQLDGALRVVGRQRPVLSALGLVTLGCAAPQILMARGAAASTAAVAWNSPLGPRVAALARDALSGGWQLRGQAQPLPAALTAWVASATVTGQFLLLAGGQALEFDTSSASPALHPLELAKDTSLADLLQAGPCAGLGPVTSLDAIAAYPWDAPSPAPPPARVGTERIAVAFQQASLAWVATFDRSDPVATLRRGLAGLAPSALALAPETPYSAAAEPFPLGASLANLQRFAGTAGRTVGACPTSLVVDAALPLGTDPLSAVPAFGGLVTVGGGARVLALTPAGDVETILPASMTSLGPAFRLAVYGGVTVTMASVEGVGSAPVAVVEHALAALGSAASLDTGSAELVVPLAAGAMPLALGGAGYGRGAVWLGDGVTGALAYAGDVAATSTLAAEKGGSAAVAVFQRDRCNPGGTRLAGSRPVTSAPDLVAQGPARAGALGPGGPALYGPADAPIYLASGAELRLYPSNAATLACLAQVAGASVVDWAGCAPAATVDLGAAPLDLTLSAGDRTVASRRLDSQCGVCAPPLQCIGGEKCSPGDSVCQRSTCLVRRELGLAGAGLSPRTRALPAAPVGVAADAASGFLVTLPCDPAAPAGRCFADGTCDGLPAAGAGLGALLHLAEDGGTLSCLAVRPSLAGPVTLTPNGAEAWVVGPALDGSLVLTRLALARLATDGSLDPERRPALVGRTALGAAAAVPASFPLSGVAFAPDGTAAVVTVPGEFRIAVIE
jgi:hypothetical protein